jgi:flagellar biosynthesis protein FlhB
MAESNKTEQASPRRRQKAREKGQIARSRDLMSSLAVGTAVLLLAVELPGFAGHWRALLGQSLGAAADLNVDPGASLLLWSGWAVVRTVGLVMGLSWTMAMLGAVAQGGLVFAPSALQPDLSRLSPATRLEQLFSLPALGRLLKSLLPGAAILYLAATLLIREWSSLHDLAHLSIARLVAYSLGHMLEIAWKATLVLLVWSAADYMIERHKLASELRMSKQDQRDEYKEMEGHPTVKARIRRLRRQVQRRRMLEEVKRASVVITNPQEFAVALEYRPEMAAPVVLAKGRNLFAQQIKQVARWHGIALVENPPLAHALYRAVEVGQTIPPKLYLVVATILAAIYRAQQRVPRAAPGKAGS